MLALPTERTEAILDGMVRALEFFAAVPREVWWDNPKTVATLILRGRQRQLHPRYAALASHYTFEAKFCLPAQAHEKPDVESGVRAVQRRFATPVPRVAGLAELNEHMRTRCLDERRRTVRSASGAFVIGDRFAEEVAAAARLPQRAFDPCIERQAVADKYQTVAFDANRYSVPRPWAFRAVTVKGYVDRVVVVAGGQVVAEHPRCYDHSQQVLDPVHYLATLERRPAALDHAPVYRDWRADGGAGRVAPRAGGEVRHAGRDAAVHPGPATARPSTRSRGSSGRSRRAARGTPSRPRRSSSGRGPWRRPRPGGHPPSIIHVKLRTLPPVSVPPPDLSRFNRLLGGEASAGPMIET